MNYTYHYSTTPKKIPKKKQKKFDENIRKNI